MSLVYRKSVRVGGKECGGQTGLSFERGLGLGAVDGGARKGFVVGCRLGGR